MKAQAGRPSERPSAARQPVNEISHAVGVGFWSVDVGLHGPHRRSGRLEEFHKGRVRVAVELHADRLTF